MWCKGFSGLFGRRIRFVHSSGWRRYILLRRRYMLLSRLLHCHWRLLCHSLWRRYILLRLRLLHSRWRLLYDLMRWRIFLLITWCDFNNWVFFRLCASARGRRRHCLFRWGILRCGVCCAGNVVHRNLGVVGLNWSMLSICRCRFGLSTWTRNGCGFGRSA